MTKEELEKMVLNEPESNIVFGEVDDQCFKCKRSLNKKEMVVHIVGPNTGEKQCYSLKVETWRICDTITQLNEIIRKHDLRPSRSQYKKIIKAIEDLV